LVRRACQRRASRWRRHLLSSSYCAASGGRCHHLCWSRCEGRVGGRERGEGSRPDLHWGVLLHRRRRPPRQVQLASMAGAADCSCPMRHRRKEQEGSRAVDRTQPCAGKSRRRRPLRAMTGGRREAPAALRSVLSRKGEGRGHVRAGPLLTGAGERGEGHGGAAPLRPPVAAASSGSS